MPRTTNNERAAGTISVRQQHLGQTRYWNGSEWLAPAGWYPDPEDPKSRRRWTGTTWVDRKSRHHSTIITGAVVFLTLQGCATALSQAPTCILHSSVSTPTTTPFAATSALWLIGLAFAIGFVSVWQRHRWAPRWLPPLADRRINRSSPTQLGLHRGELRLVNATQQMAAQSHSAPGEPRRPLLT